MFSVGAAQSLKISQLGPSSGENMNFLSLPRGPYGRCSSPRRGGKTKKRVEEKERVEKSGETAQLRYFQNRISKVVSVVPCDSQERGKGCCILLFFLFSSTARHPVVSASKFFSPFFHRLEPSIFLFRVEHPSAVTACRSFLLSYSLPNFLLVD